MKNLSWALVGLLLSLLSPPTYAADTVPLVAQMPGTQPGEISSIRSTRCDNCHGGYDPAAEPAHNLRGSMMAHAGRDPIFWATVAIAEQDFDGSGDICIRCHMHGGWQDGRSTPTDGSALTDADAASGVECELCHRLTNPDQTEHIGIQNAPFIAHDGGTPAEGFYGSGQAVIWNDNALLGPYDDAEARHSSLRSNYHRSSELCGTCHDVSNPVVGDLAHNNGAQTPLPAGTFGGADLDGKAAFNHPPYKYGVVERTFSEHKASLLAQTPVSAYASLPADLKTGAIERAYQLATAGGGNGDYEDGTQRLFSCQTCHMAPLAGGQGCNKNPRPRPDMPVHDLTGGNYWMPQAIQWMDTQGTLRLGGGLTAAEIAGMNAGILRAQSNLEAAASLSVNGNNVHVVNLTGHKLISGYPEGRRMWLNIKWYNSSGALLREDGAYGSLTVDIDGAPTQVQSLIDPHDPNTKVYEAHGAITQEWASQLIDLGYATGLPVAFDRISGDVVTTLGEVAAGNPGSAVETFHFVLNNTLVKDNRIPPYGMRYDASVERNIVPVPANQYGNPGAGGVYNHWDDVTLNPPTGAAYASVDLLYQPTSWEYIQFLHLANTGGNAFLANEGRNMLDAWLATGMAAPYVMASATWGTPPTNTVTVPDVTGLPQAEAEAALLAANLTVGTVTPQSSETVPAGHVISQDPTGGTSVASGSAVNLVVSTGPAGGGTAAGVNRLQTGYLQTTGQGRDKVTVFVSASSVTVGETVVFRATVLDNQNQPVPNATVTLNITGQETTTLTSGPSDSNGIADANWTTTAPNRKGNGGTTPGSYTATTANVTASGYTWNGTTTSVNFTLTSP